MISAIVLAAGRSQRMGRQKLLLNVGDRPMLTRIVDEVLASPVDEVLVVLRQGECEIPGALAGRPVRLVPNPDPESEMLGSVRCGLSAASPEATAILLVLGDQPGVSRRMIAELLQVFRSGEKRIVVPSYGGRRGHPLVFASHYREEILNDYDGVGVRALLQAHPADVQEVPFSTPDVLEDVDLPEDYRRVVGEPK